MEINLDKIPVSTRRIVSSTKKENSILELLNKDISIGNAGFNDAKKEIVTTVSDMIKTTGKPEEQANKLATVLVTPVINDVTHKININDSDIAGNSSKIAEQSNVSNVSSSNNTAKDNKAGNLFGARK